MTIEIFNDNWPFNSEIKQNSLLYLFYLINDSQIIIKFLINKYINNRYRLECRILICLKDEQFLNAIYN